MSTASYARSRVSSWQSTLVLRTYKSLHRQFDKVLQKQKRFSFVFICRIRRGQGTQRHSHQTQYNKCTPPDCRWIDLGQTRRVCAAAESCNTRPDVPSSVLPLWSKRNIPANAMQWGKTRIRIAHRPQYAVSWKFTRDLMAYGWIPRFGIKL